MTHNNGIKLSPDWGIGEKGKKGEKGTPITGAKRGHAPFSEEFPAIGISADSLSPGLPAVTICILQSPIPGRRGDRNRNAPILQPVPTPRASPDLCVETTLPLPGTQIPCQTGQANSVLV